MPVVVNRYLHTLEAGFRTYGTKLHFDYPLTKVNNLARLIFPQGSQTSLALRGVSKMVDNVLTQLLTQAHFDLRAKETTLPALYLGFMFRVQA